jgi:hypothetical protein
MDIVLVAWDDAWADASELVSEGDAHLKHKPTRMQTLGWLIRQDDLGVSLFNERCLDQGEEAYRGRTFIPAAMVVGVTVINAPVKRKRAKKSDPPKEG